MTGRIARLVPEKHFGFIAGDDRLDYFFHSSAVRGLPFADLRDGQAVEFEREDLGKGPRAANVRLVEGR